jgi:hypothetical protein
LFCACIAWRIISYFLFTSSAHTKNEIDDTTAKVRKLALAA